MNTRRIKKSIARVAGLGAVLAALAGCETTDYHNNHHGDRHRSGYDNDAPRHNHDAYRAYSSYRPVGYRQYGGYAIAGRSTYSDYRRY